MAMRRMFSKTITQSARFLRQSPSVRLLYYDLGMAADDDGAVEAFTVIRMTGADEKDLYALEECGLITILNDDLVCYINDWSQNNYIQSDRYHKSVYHEILPCIHNVYDLDAQVRIGKEREVKDRIEKSSLGKDSLGVLGERKKNPFDLPF